MPFDRLSRPDQLPIGFNGHPARCDAPFRELNPGIVDVDLGAATICKCISLAERNDFEAIGVLKLKEHCCTLFRSAGKHNGAGPTRLDMPMRRPPPWAV